MVGFEVVSDLVVSHSIDDIEHPHRPGAIQQHLVQLSDFGFQLRHGAGRREFDSHQVIIEVECAIADPNGVIDVAWHHLEFAREVRHEMRALRKQSAKLSKERVVGLTTCRQFKKLHRCDVLRAVRGFQIQKARVNRA